MNGKINVQAFMTFLINSPIKWSERLNPELQDFIYDIAEYIIVRGTKNILKIDNFDSEQMDIQQIAPTMIHATGNFIISFEDETAWKKATQHINMRTTMLKKLSEIVNTNNFIDINLPFGTADSVATKIEIAISAEKD